MLAKMQSFNTVNRKCVSFTGGKEPVQAACEMTRECDIARHKVWRLQMPSDSGACGTAVTEGEAYVNLRETNLGLGISHFA